MSELLPNRDIDLRPAGGLIFYEDSHSYYNSEGVKYTGMTTFLKEFEGAPFDSEGTARYKAIKETLSDSDLKLLKKQIVDKLNEPSRTAWTKVHLFYDKLSQSKVGPQIISKRQEILDSWQKSTTDGSIEHDKREKDVIENGITWNGKHYPYMDKNILEVTEDDVCVIPEIMVWDHETQLCGLIDVPIFDKGTIHILDYKTNKKIDEYGFMGRKMKGTFSHHPDCNKSKYSGQLYGYLKMALDLKPGFKGGRCIIISTANVDYGRKDDIYIECTNMSKEIDKAFRIRKTQV